MNKNVPATHFTNLLDTSNKDYVTFRFSKRAANVLSPLNCKDHGLSNRRMSNTVQNGFSMNNTTGNNNNGLKTYNEASSPKIRLGQREQNVRILGGKPDTFLSSIGTPSVATAAFSRHSN